MKKVKKGFQYSLFFSVFLLLLSQLAPAGQSPEKETLPLPPLKSSADDATGTINTPQKASSWQKHQVKIKPNGSLSQALNMVGLSPAISLEIRKLKNSSLLTNLYVGDTLDIWTDEHNNLQKIRYPKNRSLAYELNREGDDFTIKTIQYPIETKPQTTAGLIQHSFYLSGKEAGLSAKTIMNLADIFSWEIDFLRQLRPGDPFKVIYEQRYINGKYIGDGDILAAEVVTGGDTLHTAFLLKDANGEKVGYYDIKKRNLRKAFLRNPVDYVRITSRYRPKRYHPVLKQWRAHRGVDYGGPVGTPIHVTGDGQIIKRQWSHSYGRVIFVKHAGKFTTVYAHMSKFGKYKKGDWVKQGQTIGYIGQTGLATGPHLHYEFRKNGHHVDPLKVKFPDAGPVPKKYRAQFTHYASLMNAQLQRLNPHTQLVSNFE